MKKWKRRDFLRNTAIAGLLAPVATYWNDIPEARALSEKRNLVLIFMPNGKCRDNLFVQRGGGDWSFEGGFAPYERFRGDAIAFEQYSFKDFVDEHYAGDHAGHFASAQTMFSGDVPFVENDIGTAAMQPTIDQIVAWDYLDRGVITSPLRKSLAIKMNGSSFKAPSVFWQAPGDYNLGTTYTTPRVPVTLTQSPVDGFRQMFGDLAGLDGGAGIDELWAQGRSILDVPAAELATLRNQLPAEGYVIIDQHLSGLRDLERGLAEGAIDPSLPIPVEPPDLDTRSEPPERVWEEWVRLIDAAIRLDRTRIVTLQLGGIASRFHVPSLGLGYVGEGLGNEGSDHHSYTHHKQEDVPLFLEWFSSRISDLLTEMRGEGASPKSNVLADSAVMVGCEFGWNHQAHDVPVTIFGQCGGTLRTGQLLTYGNDLGQYHKHTGTLLSVCRAMGVSRLDAVGRPGGAYQQGPVSELLT